MSDAHGPWAPTTPGGGRHTAVPTQPTQGDGPPPPDVAPGAADGPDGSGTVPVTVVGEPGHHAPAHRRRRWPQRVAVVLLLLLAAALGAATWYLHGTTRAWEERAGEYLEDARGLGSEVASGRAELADTEAELAAVREQLGTAQARIVELADEKAQLGDDREVQRQLVDYQQRVSEAAGQVALALDQCVQGQQQLIGYLQSSVEGTAEYDPDQLARFGTDVEALCQAATEANIALQRELSR